MKTGKKIIMVGCGNYSDTLTYYIETFTNWKITAFTGDAFIAEKEHKGKPVVFINELEQCYPPDEYEVVLCIGYKKMNEGRKRWYNILKSMGYRFPNLIHPTAIVHNTIMGDANIIMENVTFHPNAKIGNSNIIWGSTVISHNTDVGDYNLFAASSLIAGNVKVGNNCFFGNHSTVKDGVEIADYTLVGAGTYVSKNTSEYDVIVPARAVTLDKKSTDIF